MIKNDDDFRFKTDNFSLKTDNPVVNNLNIKINPDKSLLIFSNHKNISEFLSIFMLKILNKNCYSGDIFYDNTDIIQILKKIKRFNIRNKNMLILSDIMRNVFVIPENAMDIFDESLTVSDQILDFLTYNTRIRMLNSIIRREMISHDDIEYLIKNYSNSDNKDNFLIYWATEYGVPNILDDLDKILKTGENLNEKLMGVLLYQKAGVNLADIVNLRDYYKYKTKNNVSGVNRRGNNKNIGEDELNFIDVKLKRKGNEELLKNEINKHIIEYLKFLDVNDGIYILNKKPEEIEKPILKEILLVIMIFSSADILILDNPGITDEAKKFMNNMYRIHKIFNFAYICTAYNSNVIKSYYKLFDDIKILYDSNTVEECSVEEFIKNPLHPYSKYILKNNDNPDSSMENGCSYYDLCKFAMAICRKKIPEDHEVIKNHSVACFLYDNK